MSQADKIKVSVAYVPVSGERDTGLIIIHFAVPYESLQGADNVTTFCKKVWQHIHSQYTFVRDSRITYCISSAYHLEQQETGAIRHFEGSFHRFRTNRHHGSLSEFYPLSSIAETRENVLLAISPSNIEAQLVDAFSGLETNWRFKEIKSVILNVQFVCKQCNVHNRDLGVSRYQTHFYIDF